MATRLSGSPADSVSSTGSPVAEQPSCDPATAQDLSEQHSIAVRSIGTAGIRVISALRAVTNAADTQLAELLFQAPSILATNLKQDIADQVSRLLQEMGLDTTVLGSDETIEPGDALHDIALVVRDVSQMGALLAEVVELLGVSPQQARTMLCDSPAVLMGKVSANTVAACRQRFSPLSAEVDVTRPAEAVYDVFLGKCSAIELAQVQSALSKAGVAFPEQSDQPVVVMGITAEQAERIWEQFARRPLPLRIVSRDFERFDVTLDSAPRSAEIVSYLINSTGMPERVAHKVLDRLPIVLHELVDHDEMTKHIEAVNQLGGTATGHLVLFQTFVLKIKRLGNRQQTESILQLLTEMDDTAAAEAVQNGMINCPLTHLQARWLQWELQQAGTETEKVLR